jgi:LuxR family transcriptional regulator, quorum-sensing system regulator SolR
MLEAINPGVVQLRPYHFVPPFLEALVVAASRGEDVLPFVEAIARYLGFDSFMYGATGARKPDHDAVSYVYTTLKREWVQRYDERAYIEVDPRINLTWDSAFPLVWDQRNVRGMDVRVDAFLEDAMTYGIASGIAFMFHGAHNSHVVVALNSSIGVCDAIRHDVLVRNLPLVIMFGHYFHEIFMRSVIEKGLAPRAAGAPLSRRECECLELAASGQTTGDIANKLSITHRTVQFHFDSIRTKLRAANRQEAIAIGIRSGAIRTR